MEDLHSIHREPFGLLPSFSLSEFTGVQQGRRGPRLLPTKPSDPTAYVACRARAAWPGEHPQERGLPGTLTKALVPSSTSRKSWRRTAESVKCMISAYKGKEKGFSWENSLDFRSQEMWGPLQLVVDKSLIKTGLRVMLLLH